MIEVTTGCGGPVARKTVLANGIRVLTESLDHLDSVSLGVWVTAGSRDDPPGHEGVTHLLEHMLFKRTETRSTLDIAKAIDDIGGHVNGFTDREGMYLYARTVGEHLEPALDLLLDQLLHSVCAEEDVTREREVVTQEIAHLQDSPEDWMHELVPQTVWRGHPLGRPLLGTKESVAGIGSETLLEYLEELRAANRVLVTAVGRVEHDRVVELTSRLAQALESRAVETTNLSPRFHGERRMISQPGMQTHFCLATPACARTDDARDAFAVLDALLGGGSSSRLFQEIRENRGLAYGIGSYFQPYRDAGVFVIDGGTAPENLELVFSVIDDELERLRCDALDEEDVERSKTQLRVSLALATESTSFRMQHLAVSDIYWGRVLPYDEIAGGIDGVTPDQVKTIARTVFTEGKRAVMAIGPLSNEVACHG